MVSSALFDAARNNGTSRPAPNGHTLAMKSLGDVWDTKPETLEECFDRMKEGLAFRKVSKGGAEPSYNPVRSHRMASAALHDAIEIFSDTEAPTIEQKKLMLTMINESYFSAQWASYEDTWFNQDPETFAAVPDQMHFEVPLDNQDRIFVASEMKQFNIPLPHDSTVEQKQEWLTRNSALHLKTAARILDIADILLFDGMREEEKIQSFGAEYGEHCRLKGVNRLRTADRLLAIDPASTEALSLQQSALPYLQTALEISFNDASNDQLFKRIAINYCDACRVVGKFDAGIKFIGGVLAQWEAEPETVAALSKNFIAATHCAHIDLLSEHLRSGENLDDATEGRFMKSIAKSWEAAVSNMLASGIDRRFIISELKDAHQQVSDLGFEGRSLEEIADSK